MQVQEQADVHRLPVGLPDVVEGIPVASQFLLGAAAQVLRAPHDDAVSPLLVLDDHAFERRGRLDGLNPSAKSELLQQAGHLRQVQAFETAPDVRSGQGARQPTGNLVEECHPPVEAAHEPPKGSRESSNVGVQ